MVTADRCVSTPNMIVCTKPGWPPVRRGAAICLAATSTYSLLTAALVGLRVAGVLDWPWVWVFSPIWLPLSAVGAVAAIQLLREYID